MNNLKETYNVVCNLLSKITKQEFSIQDVDDRNNIADFNIICNDDWQVLYPTLQEEFASIGNYDTLHVPAKETKFYHALDSAIDNVCDVEGLQKPYYSLYLDETALDGETTPYGVYDSLAELMTCANKIFKSYPDTLTTMQNFNDTSGLVVSVNTLNHEPYLKLKIDLNYFNTDINHSYYVLRLKGDKKCQTKKSKN